MKKFTLASIGVLMSVFSFGQGILISSSPGSPDNSAALDVESTSKGLLPPRMSSAQRDQIENPAAGLMIYNIDTNCPNYFNGTGWMSFCGEPVFVPIPFVCGVSTVSDVEDHVYSTVLIGGQCWTVENLKTGTFRNGDPIPNVTGQTAWAELTTGAWSHFNNNSSNETLYGKLYNAYAVNDSRGICPEGWHVPSHDEWIELIDLLGGSDVAGGKLKTIGTVNWQSPNTGATNEVGFSALPGGYRLYNGIFYSLGQFALFWSSTEFMTDLFHNQNIGFSYANAYSNLNEGRVGFSVRCLRD